MRLDSIRKIVIAPDSFKGSISAHDAAEAIRVGLLQGWGGAETAPELLCVPIADGGEGTLDALVAPEHRISVTVTGPDGAPCHAQYGGLGDTAVIEMAGAAGLTLIPQACRSAAKATTYGVGELIRHAIRRGYRSILLTVGGSATNDGGCGMLAALGAEFRDARGHAFLPTGGTLSEIAAIELAGLDPLLSQCRFNIAADVRNPLCGETGATRIYARQKGAADRELDEMERGMKHYADLLCSLCGRPVADIEGCGAGGGLAAPLLAFADTEIRSGIEAVLSTLHFDQALQGAGLVITGEGKIDRQSLFGKAISGVAKAAGARGIPVYCFVGCMGDDKNQLLSMGVRDILAISDYADSPEDSMRRAGELLESMAADFASRICGL